MSNKNWFKICNAVESPDEAEVLIYDEIGIWGTTAKAFVEALRAIKAKRFHVRINSPGGNVFEGLAIYNFLRSRDVRVTVDGLAASIASVVAMAGRTVTMARGSLMMIHNPWAGVVGGQKDMEDAAARLAKIRDSIVTTYADRTGMDEKTIKEWMDEEKWLNASECVAHGFADDLDPEMEAANFAAFNLSQFKHPPAVDTATKGKAMQTPEQVHDELTELTEAKSQADKTISDLQASNTALTGERDKLTVDLKAANDALTESKRVASESEAKIKLLEKQAKDAIESVEPLAAQRAADILAQAGHRAVEQGADAETTGGNILEQYQKAQRGGNAALAAQLWSKHKATIISLAGKGK